MGLKLFWIVYLSPCMNNAYWHYKCNHTLQLLHHTTCHNTTWDLLQPRPVCDNFQPINWFRLKPIENILRPANLVIMFRIGDDRKTVLRTWNYILETHAFYRYDYSVQAACHCHLNIKSGDGWDKCCIEQVCMKVSCERQFVLYVYFSFRIFEIRMIFRANLVIPNSCFREYIKRQNYLLCQRTTQQFI